VDPNAALPLDGDAGIEAETNKTADERRYEEGMNEGGQTEDWQVENRQPIKSRNWPATV
jgi:hypothetical protein